MSSKGRRLVGRAVLAVAIPLIAAAASAASKPLPLTGWDAAAVERARAGAVRRIQDGECRKLFSDFSDAQGRPLQSSLEESGQSPAEYVGSIPFIDGSSQPLCRDAMVKLAARPGVRHVVVCKAFADFQLRQPRVAESMIIHEMLHTLGLGENPPSSVEITQRVEARCWAPSK